jgi:hypothetical protein
MILEVTDLHTYYGTSHILFGVCLGRHRGGCLLAGEKWGRQDNNNQEHYGVGPSTVWKH